MPTTITAGNFANFTVADGTYLDITADRFSSGKAELVGGADIDVRAVQSGRTLRLGPDDTPRTYKVSCISGSLSVSPEPTMSNAAAAAAAALGGGLPNSVATLDGEGKVPAGQLGAISLENALPAFAYGASEVQATLDNAYALSDYAALSTYAGRAKTIRLTAAGVGGVFCYLADLPNTTIAGYQYAHASGSGAWRRVGADAINVQWCGAKGDGVSSDGPAFVSALQSAVDSRLMRVLVPCTNKYYKVANCTVPSGVELVGIGRKRVYTATTLAAIEGSCAVVYDNGAAGATYCMAFAGNNHISDLNFYGVDKSCAGFGPGSGGGLFFDRVSMLRFSVGFGQASAATGNSRLFNCHAASNGDGFRNFVDSHFYGCEVNANDGTGINQQTGANDCTFVGTKCEWNAGANWVFYQSANCSIVGGVTDRSGGNYGFDIRQSHLTISGTVVRRSGRNALTGSAHFAVGSNTCLTLNGVITRNGANDDSSGLNTPEKIFHVVDSSSGPIIVNGSDVSGSTGGLRTTSNTLAATFAGCRGAPDTVRTFGEGLNTAVATGETLTVTATSLEILGLNTNTYQVRRYRVRANFRNGGTGGVAYNEFLIAVTRGSSGGAAAAIYAPSNSGSTSINTTGATVNVTVSNVASDGLSFDVVLTNTGAATLQIAADITPF